MNFSYFTIICLSLIYSANFFTTVSAGKDSLEDHSSFRKNGESYDGYGYGYSYDGSYSEEYKADGSVNKEMIFKSLKSLGQTVSKMKKSMRKLSRQQLKTKMRLRNLGANFQPD